jgi:hypothetical protein
MAMFGSPSCGAQESPQESRLAMYFDVFAMVIAGTYRMETFGVYGREEEKK